MKIDRTEQSVTLIAATDLAGNIGKNNELPWGRPIPEDMKIFRAETMGKTIIMGFNTLLSIGKALPGRHNVVLTRKGPDHPDRQRFEGQPIVFVDNRKEALNTGPSGPIYVIGGAQVFRLFQQTADHLVLSVVNTVFSGCDTKFAPLPFSPWSVGNAWLLTGREHVPAKPYDLFVYRASRVNGRQLDLPLPLSP